MTRPARYAVYFAPHPDSQLWRFGSAVIGYDAANPRVPSLLEPDRLRTERSAGWFDEPARYGFHGTLKAPFELAPGTTEEDLVEAAASFAARTAAFDGGRLEVISLDRFVALVPVVPPPALADLAARCVVDFDPFRAPLAPADRERRLKAGLTAAEISHLDRWGYPYVLELFRFHMTLSGPLPKGQLEPIRARIADLYAPLADALPVDGIAIFKQPDRASRFHIAGRFALRG